MPDLDIHYEDPDILVINKPPGLLSVPGRGEDKYDSVQSRCREIAPEAMAAHRLDMATGGLLLIAKHKAAERHYKQEFAARRVEKRYIALAHGILTPTSGDIRYPLITDWERRPRQKIDYEHGKNAHTGYRVLVVENGNSRVALTPHTGRSHQLRVHLAAIGHPILGDEFYADEHLPPAPRLMLHAETLTATNLRGIRQLFHLAAPF